MSLVSYLKLLVRRRTKDIFELETVFHRCLRALDVTLLSLGSMLGAGLYIATGDIARSTAGPAIVLSLLIAAVPACICSLCYAEFGSRISRTGSSYTYTYFAIGEVWAFWVGWNLILETTIAVALLGHEVSRFLNVICGGYIYKFFNQSIADWHVDGFLQFPDFLAFLIVVIFTAVSALGAKRTASYIRIATLINILVILFVVLAGVYYVDTKNWSTAEKFIPYGFHGIMVGAASSYFSYLGFDILNTASEEAIDPKTIIPYANTISTYAGVVVYLVIAAILTLMIPYNKLSPNIALPDAFSYEGFPLGKYFVAVGGVFAMTTSLLAYLFSGARIIYAMANDGLFFRFFGTVNRKTQVPVRAVCFSGIVAATIALFVDTNKLVEMLSIGTLLAYTMVALAVVLNRCHPPDAHDANGLTIKVSPPDTKHPDADEPLVNVEKRDESSFCPNLMDLWRRRDKPNYTALATSDETHTNGTSPRPTQQTYTIACMATACFVFSVFGFCLSIVRHHMAMMFLAGLMGLLAIASFIVLYLQPQCSLHMQFSVPFVPAVPLFSVVINEYLLTNLSKITWASFAAWTFLGYVIYFAYGIHHSNQTASEDDLFLLKYSPPNTTPNNKKLLSRTSEDCSAQSMSSTSSDEDVLSSMLITSEEDKSK